MVGHIPSDAEWNEMELALGMPLSGTTWIGYRGLHALSINLLQVGAGQFLMDLMGMEQTKLALMHSQQEEY